MKSHRLVAGIGVLVLVVASGSRVARADYFFDQGFVRAPVRTDYDDPRYGTAAMPLRKSACLYPDAVAPGAAPQCNAGATVFDQSNHYARGVGADGRYWTVMANNEPVTIDASRSGPPGQSLPIAPPGGDIMGFTTVPADAAGGAQEAHLVLVNLFNNPHRPTGQYAIPFLSIYLDDDHGNGGVLGALNDPARPHVVTWVSSLYGHDAARDPYPAANGNRGMWSHFFWVASEWGGKPRMVFLNLSWNGISWSGRWRAGLHAHWNWPYPDSGIYPGGDLAYLNAGEIGINCRALDDVQPIFKRGTVQRYTVDLQDLFRCASDMELFDEPMPLAGALPIRTVGWANEGSGFFYAWTAVRDMRMLDPAAPVAAAPSSSKAIGAARESSDVARIRAAVEAACLAQPACGASRARDSGAGAPTFRVTPARIDAR